MRLSDCALVQVLVVDASSAHVTTTMTGMSIPHYLSYLNLLPIQILMALPVIPYLQNTIVHRLVRRNLSEYNSPTSLAIPGPYRQALASRLSSII